MKTIKLLLATIIVSSCGGISPTYLNYKDYSAEKEISCNQPKQELFVAGYSWLVENFNSANNVIQYYDKETGVIIGRYLMAGNSVAGEVFAVVSLRVKDNMTKIKVTPLGVGKYYTPEPGYVVPQGSPSEKEIMERAKKLIDDYEVYIQNYKAW